MKQYTRYFTLIFFTMFIACGEKETHELTPLELRGGDPFFATYAAAMERSNFLTDQGYEFSFYKKDDILGFTSDQGGDIGVGFLVDGKMKYLLKDMHSEPVINYTFPDMVSYYWYPVEDIRCDALFLVERSEAAVFELEFTNTGRSEKEFTLIPFIRNQNRTFNNIHQDNGWFYFDHEKYPDAWTQSQGLPHHDSLTNIIQVNAELKSHAALNSFSDETPSISFSMRPDKTTEFQITGRAYTSDQERILENPPHVRIQAWTNNNRDQLITERSPLWGDFQPHVVNGFFSLELGGIINPDQNNQISLLYYHVPENLIARYDTMSNRSFRKDVYPTPNILPLPPVKIFGNKVMEGYKLQWERADESYTYDIYRRAEEQDVYTRIALNISDNFFIDRDGRNDKLFRYLIVSNDPRSGKSGIHSEEFANLPVASMDDFIADKNIPELKTHANHLVFKSDISLKPGEKKKIRLVRVTGTIDSDRGQLRQVADSLMDIAFDPYLQYNIDLFSEANKKAQFDNPEWNLLYMSANNLMRQVFYPPEGESSYNYYVFSREPVWGWGHGGQVFHESITMLAYADMDPISAMNSQRVYSERQYDNGYINYRTGSYLNEIIEHNDELTSSAPWYSWLNWEIYKMTSDREFLEEMYSSSKRFYNFFIETRDKDEDGLLEWGGHAVLESVRDALVAVWDEVGWPSNFDGVDINSMMVMEAKSLEAMAKELGKTEEAEMWQADHEKRAELINRHMWDKETGFYYNVDKKTNTFTFKEKNDLKRQEIIGFLPLWAGIASEEQAAQLVKALTDPEKFWRPKGIPSLSAADSFYNPKGYWNGPVWVQWNYLIMRGLLDYGYEKEARELVDRVAGVMIEQLKENHNLWEFYSPDHNWGGYHKTYIWAGIINRMMLDVQHIQTGR